MPIRSFCKRVTHTGVRRGGPALQWSWVNPIATYDPAGTWTDDALARDDDTTTFAYSAGGDNTNPFGARLDDYYPCTKIRLWCTRYDDLFIEESQLDAIVDVYADDGTWHTVYTGLLNFNTWHEIEFAQMNVQYWRVTPQNLTDSAYFARIYEGDFWIGQ